LTIHDSTPWISSRNRTGPGKKTKWLVIYFILAVAAMIAAIYVVSLLIFSGVQAHQHRFNEEQPQLELWNPQIFFAVALGTIAVILIGSSYKTMALPPAAARFRK
jgi:uncharacterized membrane protein